MFKSIFIPIVAVAIFIIFVGLLSQGKFESFFKEVKPTPNSRQKIVKIENLEIEVEVARTNDERAKGLSNKMKIVE